MVLILNNLEFFKTCEFCPEQYEVNVVGDETLVGYVRLRWGVLTLKMPDCRDGDIIYEHNFNEEFKGAFDNKKEQMMYLRIIAEEVLKELK